MTEFVNKVGAGVGNPSAGSVICELATPTLSEPPAPRQVPYFAAPAVTTDSKTPRVEQMSGWRHHLAEPPTPPRTNRERDFHMDCSRSGEASRSASGRALSIATFDLPSAIMGCLMRPPHCDEGRMMSPAR